MTGLVTPYGLMELGLAGVVAPLYPRAEAGWINPRFRARPGLAWAVYSIALGSVLIAIAARVLGSPYSSLLQMLLLPPVLYWWLFANMDRTPPQGGAATDTAPPQSGENTDKTPPKGGEGADRP